MAANAGAGGGDGQSFHLLSGSGGQLIELILTDLLRKNLRKGFVCVSHPFNR
jgi:hypothetical protein